MGMENVVEAGPAMSATEVVTSEKLIRRAVAAALALVTLGYAVME
jgi:hypothetical protein